MSALIGEAKGFYCLLRASCCGDRSGVILFQWSVNDSNNGVDPEYCSNIRIRRLQRPPFHSAPFVSPMIRPVAVRLSLNDYHIRFNDLAIGRYCLSAGCLLASVLLCASLCYLRALLGLLGSDSLLCHLRRLPIVCLSLYI